MSDVPWNERIDRSGTVDREEYVEERFRTTDRSFFGDDDVRWLAVALLAGVVVYATYVLTHQYPAYGAGLYLQIAERISANGYTLPARIPKYTREGVPFAYPPLMFYVTAVVRDLTGVGPVTYARYVPGMLVLAYLVPYYFMARRLLASPRLAGYASVLFAATPAVLQWHLSAGGLVRAMAMLLVLTGTYAGIRLFRARDVRWLPPAVLAFGLTVLTHPVYTVFFGLTYVLLFLRFDRTPRGLAVGTAVATGGLVLAAPWWIQVVHHHGVDVFLAAAGTHSGLGGGPGRVATAFLSSPRIENVFYLGAYPGILYALYRREWFLPAWLAVPAYVINKPRFQFVAGSLLTAVLVGQAVLPRLEHTAVLADRRQLLNVVVAAVVVFGAMGVGTAFAAGALNTHDGSSTMPAFIDDEDRAAMTWTARNTTESSTFVVLGDAAEWFPVFAERTILVGPWGVEWTTPGRYRFQLELYRSVSDCGDAACLSHRLRRARLSPDYVYVPKDHYTVRGIDHAQSRRMRSSLIASDRYEVVYENEGAMLVRVTTGAAESD